MSSGCRRDAGWWGEAGGREPREEARWSSGPRWNHWGPFTGGERGVTADSQVAGLGSGPGGGAVSPGGWDTEG